MLKILAFSVSALILSVEGKPVPAGAKLDFYLTFRENDPGRPARSTPPFHRDDYSETIWIEGPYDPSQKCQIVNFERQNIKLVKVIRYFRGKELKSNISWNVYPEYRTPDFESAIITAGLFTYCTVFPFDSLHQCTGSLILAPATLGRRDPVNGGLRSDGTSPICRIHTRAAAPPFIMQMGSLDRIPDGITTATRPPNTTITNTWDLRDRFGNLIEEGYYLVNITLNDHRNPDITSIDTLVGGLRVLGLETCWDNPYYDTLGPHRVVELVQFKDSAFTKVVQKEKRWSRDHFDYLKNPAVIAYSIPQGIEKSGRRSIGGDLISASPNPFMPGTEIGFPVLNKRRLVVSIIDFRGKRVRTLFDGIPEPGYFKIKWDGRNERGGKLAAGSYLVRVDGAPENGKKKLVLLQ